MQPLLEGLGNLVYLPGAPLALAGGCLAGLIVGLMPGVNSRSGLLIAIPFVLAFQPLVGAIFLVSLHAASQVSGTVPAVIFGTPTSASEAATAMDGYPLALRGEGARVIGTIVSASAIGGVAGAAVLLLMAPLGARIILAFGSPEIAALATAGILAIAAVSSRGLAAGVALGAAGILASTVGLDAIGAVPRFTFRQDTLLDGLNSTALIAGMMAFPELLRVEDGRQRVAIGPNYRRIVDGAIEPFRHLGLTLRSSLLGLVVGITPGIGASVSVWLAYAQATRTARPSTPFGEGAIEGVIAPEVAGGSKEGGAFIPTLLLGVPGSSGMAIMLSAFATIGIHVGPTMLTQQPSLPATVAWAIAAADLLAMLICIALAPAVVRLASLPRGGVVVFALAAAALAAYWASPHPATALQMLGFGLFGLVLARAGLSRPAFLIGFVIGPVFENALLRSSLIYGPSALWRPGVIVIAVLIVAAVVYLTRRQPGPPQRRTGTALSRLALPPLLGLALVFVGAILLARGFGARSGFVPIVAASAGLAAALWAAAQAWRGGIPDRPFVLNLPLALILAAALILAVFFGAPVLALPILSLAVPWLRNRLGQARAGR